MTETIDITPPPAVAASVEPYYADFMDASRNVATVCGTTFTATLQADIFAGNKFNVLPLENAGENARAGLIYTTPGGGVHCRTAEYNASSPAITLGTQADIQSAATDYYIAEIIPFKNDKNAALIITLDWMTNKDFKVSKVVFPADGAGAPTVTHANSGDAVTEFGHTGNAFTVAGLMTHCWIENEYDNRVLVSFRQLSNTNGNTAYRAVLLNGDGEVVDSHSFASAASWSTSTNYACAAAMGYDAYNDAYAWLSVGTNAIASCLMQITVNEDTVTITVAQTNGIGDATYGFAVEYIGRGMFDIIYTGSTSSTTDMIFLRLGYNGTTLVTSYMSTAPIPKSDDYTRLPGYSSTKLRYKPVDPRNVASKKIIIGQGFSGRASYGFSLSAVNYPNLFQNSDISTNNWASEGGDGACDGDNPRILWLLFGGSGNVCRVIVIEAE